jgi:hypothetical protein
MNVDDNKILVKSFSLVHLPTIGDLKMGLNQVAVIPASFKCSSRDSIPFKSPIPSPFES